MGNALLFVEAKTYSFWAGKIVDKSAVRKY
jgi:hypothetical protein